MILILACYLKAQPKEIQITSLDNINNDEGFTRFINVDDYLYNGHDNMLKNDLYSLMLDILVNNYGNKFTTEIVDNQQEYTNFFKDNFEYNYELVGIPVDVCDDDDDDNDDDIM